MKKEQIHKSFIYIAAGVKNIKVRIKSRNSKKKKITEIYICIKHHKKHTMHQISQKIGGSNFE